MRLATDRFTLRVARSDGAARSRFELERGGSRVLLDLIVRAAAEDASLFYRFSCRSGYCGTCTVQLDGSPVLACRTPLPEGSATIHLGPLGGLPVVRDLVVDPAPFDERWRSIDPGLQPMSAAAVHAPGGASPATVRAIEESLDCISCGACFAACDRAADGVPFLGPAALNRAAVLVADPRDAARGKRLAQVAGPDGLEGCRGIGACSVACPNALDPSRSIRRLRRWRARGLP